MSSFIEYVVIIMCHIIISVNIVILLLCIMFKNCL